MKKIWIAITLMAILLSGCEPSFSEPEDDRITRIDQNDLKGPYISYYGRHTFLNNRMYFYHTATGFHVEFYGRVLEITLKLEQKNEDIYYSVGKNGEDLLESDIFIQKEAIETFVITFDTYDTHKVDIVKRSEPEDGITSLVSVSTNGHLLVPEKIDAMHFLIIGASGISGHGALGLNGTPRTTENSSSLHSFGYLTAKAFNGTFEFVSSSGWGLLYGYNDTSGQDNIAKAYDYVGITPNRRIVLTEHNKMPIPDVIIINLGGNDFTSVINRLSGFDRSAKVLEFKDAVIDFILKLRRDAPNAHIIWTMTTGSQNGNAAKEAILTLDLNDQAFVHVVIIRQVGEFGDPEGANNHASYLTHQQSALNIIQHIHQIKQQETQ